MKGSKFLKVTGILMIIGSAKVILLGAIVAGFGAHGIGDADELAEILAVDDREQHQRAAGAIDAARGKAHRAVAFLAVVDEDEEFSRIVEFSHAPPRAVAGGAFSHSQ